MSTEGIVAGALMLVLAVAWLALPLLRRRYSASGEELSRQKDREALLTTYERTLAVMRDLDEDRLTGKLAQPDYDSERAYWAEQGVAILEALEKMGVKKPAKQRKPVRQPVEAVEADPDAALDDAIEQAIANYAKSAR